MAEAAFKIEEQTQYLLIRCPEQMPATIEKDLEKSVKTWLLNAAPIFIIDFFNVETIEREVLRHWIQFSRLVRKNGKHLYSIRVSQGLGKQIAELGLQDTFAPVTDLHEALKRAGVDNGQTKVQFGRKLIQVFSESVVKTFKVQLNIDVAPQPLSKSNILIDGSMDIVSIIQVRSAEFSWTIALGFPKTSFLAMYEKMLGEKHTEINSDNQDAAGELLNIVFGTAKTTLVDTMGIQVKMAIPAVLVGDKLKISYVSKQPIISVPFKFNEGGFTLQMVIQDT